LERANGANYAGETGGDEEGGGARGNPSGGGSWKWNPAIGAAA